MAVLTPKHLFSEYFDQLQVLSHAKFQKLVKLPEIIVQSSIKLMVYILKILINLTLATQPIEFRRV